MLHLALAALVTLANVNADGNARARRFPCPELQGLPHNSRAYRDTLQACKWDYEHPLRNPENKH